jgi:ArsR family transcriptional regulator, arsenate/arsenite/antimonite-responsive transcriptional repressor
MGSMAVKERAPAGTPEGPGEDGVDGEIARLAKALGHPARVRILRLLIERAECVCGEICDELPLAQSTVSQHLKVLRRAGLIEGEVDGPRVCYCADPSAVERLRALLGAVLAPASGCGSPNHANPSRRER